MDEKVLKIVKTYKVFLSRSTVNFKDGLTQYLETDFPRELKNILVALDSDIYQKLYAENSDKSKAQKVAKESLSKLNMPLLDAYKTINYLLVAMGHLPLEIPDHLKKEENVPPTKTENREDSSKSEFVNNPPSNFTGKGKTSGSTTQGIGWEYEGDFVNGKQHGKGMLFFSNGDVYEGDFVEGKCHGKGKYTDASGNVYEGDFVDNKRQGKGKFVLSDGNVYEGDVVDNKRQGKGKLIWSNGAVYEGDFVNGNRTGKGKLVFSDGAVYEGDYVDDNRTGKGKYIFASGDVYEGDFVNGNRTGKGKLVWTDGNVYEGDFVDGKIEGIGKKTYVTGKTEYGEWKDGKLVKEIDIIKKKKVKKTTNFTFINQVRLANPGKKPTPWSSSTNSITANPGDTVQYLLTFTNTGDTQIGGSGDQGIVIQDYLASNLTYVKGSSKAILAGGPTHTLFDNWIGTEMNPGSGQNIGGYASGINAQIQFSAQISESSTEDTLENVAKIYTPHNGSQSAIAKVIVQKTQNFAENPPANFTGKGKLVSSNGDVYEGDFVDGKQTGKGKLTFVDGAIYEGDFVKGKYEGKGKFKVVDGAIYEGDFVNGMLEGKGKFTGAYGHIYKGDFVDGIFEGKGKFKVLDGDTYEGDFLDGKSHGKGKFTSINGDIYEGDFVDGKRNGKAKYTWANGDIYVGDFVDGNIEGIGKLTRKDGMIDYGEWKENKLIKNLSMND